MNYKIAAAGLLVVVIALIWLFPYLPMADLPEHILIAKILSTYGHSDLGYEHFFTAEIPWNPYSAYFLFVFGASRFVSVENATKVYLSLALASTILTFWYWLRVVAPNRQPQIVPATLLLFGLFFYIGMMNFLISVPLLFLAITLGWQLHTRPRPGATPLLLALTLVASYFAHGVTFLVALLVLAFQWLIFFRRQPLWLVAAVVPSVMLLAIYFLLRGGGDVGGSTLFFNPFGKRLENLLWPFAVFQDPVDGTWQAPGATAYWWAGIAVLIIAGWRREKWNAPSLCTAALLVGGTLLLPSTVGTGLPIAMRVSYPAAFAALGAASAGWHERRTLRYAMFVTCFAAVGWLGWQFKLFQQEMQNMESVIAAIPEQRVVQPVITEPHSPYFRTYPFLHAAAWYCFYRGGTSSYLFTGMSHFPVRDRRKFIDNPPGEWNMNAFKYEQHQHGSDYFLVRTKSEQIVVDLRSHVPLLAQSGDWMVFGPNRHAAESF